MSSAVIATLLFLASAAITYAFGYITGFQSAIDQMKKVRRKNGD